RRMAKTLGERVGITVGYRVRRDVRVSSATRIEVVTEGILTRMLQSDPGLEGVGCVIFDEYHERSLAADLGLAFALEAQAALRDDLRLLIMSATLDGERIAAMLTEAGEAPVPVVSSHGRAFPIETRYLDTGDARDRRPVWLTLPERIADAVRLALSEESGSVLAFLPGVGEIRRTESLLRAGALPKDVRLAPLYGTLDQRAQDAALAPAPAGTRKVVLATPIAESSLTIEGVRVVIDGGYARAPRFSPRTGMTSLETVRVSRASADQRRGRAGRTEPGVCYRLWGVLDDQHLAPFAPPEIVETDLAPLALELAVWGVPDADSLHWLDAPPQAALSQARDLLRQLGALDARGVATTHGRAISQLGLHPRLGHLLLRGRELGIGRTACNVAALLSQRDPMRARDGATADADVRLRLDDLQRERGASSPLGLSVDRGAVQRIREEAEHLARLIGLAGTHRSDTVDSSGAAGLLTALAYPDRIAQRTSNNRYKLRTGHAAALSHDQLLSESAYLAIAALDDRRGAAKVFSAAPLTSDDLETHFADHIEAVDLVEWSADAGRVVARRQRRLGALVLSDGPLVSPDPDALADALLNGIREAGLQALPWSKSSRGLQDRLRFLHHHRPDQWPDVSDATLLTSLEVWLRPHLIGRRRLDEVRALDLSALLLTPLDWQQRNALDRLAPSHLTVPSGSNRPLDYSTPETPVLAVRLQEVFGLMETPRLLDGTVAVTMHLLSPAQRPVQVTQDLAGFWAWSYFDVRKDLRGRYPKHHWPENPLEATPTARAKRRRS
ncbi:MAG: ATP-dependent helicase HrpB, partial [Bacteroidota bacterium]